MPKINFFSDKINVKNKRVIVRLDLNVSMKESVIIDDTRIKVSKPLIEDLIQKGAIIILISHTNFLLVHHGSYWKKRDKTLYISNLCTRIIL